MSKNGKRQHAVGGRTGHDRKIARARDGEGVLPIREPAPGTRTQPHPHDEHRSPRR